MELPHASLSYQDGMGAAIVAPFGGISVRPSSSPLVKPALNNY